MSQMFFNNRAKVVNIKNLNTESVLNMRSMFRNTQAEFYHLLIHLILVV